ncbi:DUF1546-domain-containing protein [Hypoxylon sp. NC1633]|nr:DUF1546-domain-containing protein [Hypoxylon sp. NC1633]
MSAARDNRGSAQEIPNELRLLWNPEMVKDIGESVGITSMPVEPLRILCQDVEYRVGQLISEAIRSMRLSKRNNLTVSDANQALKVLNVDPLFGYESARPLRYGEASLGSQALYYVEDEEMEFEKMINIQLPKVPRDMSATWHWHAVEGVLVNCLENPSSGEPGKDHMPKGFGPPASLANIVGQDRPAVKHMISQELILYFNKIQAAIMDESPDAEVQRLREAAFESVSTEPGIHQLVPYFTQFIASAVTHNLDDLFVLRQMMELTKALVANERLHTAPYATALCAPVLTCILGRQIGPDNGVDGLKEQYELREFAATLVGQIARKYAKDNKLLRPKLLRTSLKNFLNVSHPPAVWYGAVCALVASGNPDVTKVLLLRNLKLFETTMLMPLGQKNDAISQVQFEALVGAIMKAIKSLAGEDSLTINGMNGYSSNQESVDIKEFLGDIIGQHVMQLGDHRLNQVVLEARQYK